MLSVSEMSSLLLPFRIARLSPSKDQVLRTRSKVWLSHLPALHGRLCFPQVSGSPEALGLLGGHSQEEAVGVLAGFTLWSLAVGAGFYEYILKLLPSVAYLFKLFLLI